MAEQIPYGVATSLINTLASLVSREISIYGFQTEIKTLKNTVEGIKAVLADADRKQRANQGIELWIRNLKDVLYEADDLFDEILAQHLLQQRDSKGKGKVRYFFSSSNPFAFRHKVARKIRNIREPLNAVAETMYMFPLSAIVETKHEKSSNWRETSAEHRENIIGREESEKEVVDLLLNNNNKNENVSVVAVTGIGGLGKTTLARLVFNNAQVNNFFDKRMWVSVSQDFDVKALVKKILESLFGNYVNDQPLELLQHKLRKDLNGQRYLLVLDDVWNEDREKWFHLKRYLMCGAEGSKILVTTRNQTVANKMGVKTPYVLQGLNNDASWTLLKRLAFDQDQIMPQNLESIGQQIAEKCAGVPLAIRVMGSLLQSKSQESEWRAILEGDFWKLCEANTSIMPILKLGYDNLAIELKQCFVYCSLYPVDWLYERDELIDLWMAQGFLENEDQKQCPEDVGKEYVRILLMKSFLQDVKMDEFGEIKCFKMHDLMHALSQSVASSDYFLYVEGSKNVASSCPLHASFEEYNPNSSANMLNASRLRTFLEIKRKYTRDPSDLFALKSLRSFDLSYYKIRDLPESIGSKMSHLRYLNLSDCYELTCLPKSISNLVNLQTLRLNRCHNLKFCGDIITKLINLRRLGIEDCKAFDDGMPVELGRMTNLQNLSHFIVGNDDKERKKAKLNEVKELSLRGSLVIENLHLVRDVQESKDVNLSTKGRLISLTLKWGRYPEMENSDAMKLLENLRPHQNLKALTVQGYPGVRFSDWLSSRINLVELKFSNFKKCKYLVALEGLVSLKTLHIEYMHKLEYISYKGCSSSTGYLPSLEELKIEWCGSLRGWLREANDQNTSDNECHHSLPPFRHLSSLQIEGCPNLRCMPTFPNLVSRLDLMESSTKPLENTLNDVAPSLSKLKSLRIRSIDIEALPEEWMKKLSSLKHLSIAGFSSLEKPFRHMQNLSATLEQFEISFIDSWNGDEYYNIQWEDLLCLHSLQRIEFSHCDQLLALPEWICDLQSLRLIQIEHCEKLQSFPERMHGLTNLQTLRLDGAPLLKERCRRETGADWPKVAHIPNIWID